MWYHKLYGNDENVLALNNFEGRGLEDVGATPMQAMINMHIQNIRCVLILCNTIVILREAQ